MIARTGRSMPRVLAVLGLLGGLTSVPGIAQRGARPSGVPEFDVVSIKPNSTTDPLYYKSFADRFVARGMTAKRLMTLGWQLRDFQIAGGPAWFASDRFDIEATSGQPVTWGQMQLMFRSLLKERFGLAFHGQTREAPVYDLVIARSGRVKPSPDQTLWTGDHPDEPNTTGANMDIGPGSLSGDSIPMAMFVGFLSGQVGRNVVNRTGLTGRYAMELRWSPDAVPAFEELAQNGHATRGHFGRVSGRSGAAIGGLCASPEAAEPAPGASLFTSIQEQLGLRLVSSRGPVEVLVIDRVEKPSGN